MQIERIYRLKDGGRVKLSAQFADYHNGARIYVSCSICPKGKKKFQTLAMLERDPPESSREAIESEIIDNGWLKAVQDDVIGQILRQSYILL